MTFPNYENPVQGEHADLYAAVYDFIAKFALPALPPENILRGWQNYSHLPSRTNDYAVISILGSNRVGTTVETYDATKAAPDEDGILTADELVQVRVQIDFCSGTDDLALRRAQCIENVARSSVGSRFFKDYGIGCNFATNPMSLSFIGGENQNVRRWSLDLHLSHKTSVKVHLPWFDKVNLERVENVEEHHDYE